MSVGCKLVDSAFLRSLKVNFARLIAYAESADIQLQREVILYSVELLEGVCQS